MSRVDELMKSVVTMCQDHNWSMAWSDRGVYLHLEVSELIEAIRGKGSTVPDEAGDVLITLLALLYPTGIKFHEVVVAAEKNIQEYYKRDKN